jgi:hypothetical protein
MVRTRQADIFVAAPAVFYWAEARVNRSAPPSASIYS